MLVRDLNETGLKDDREAKCRNCLYSCDGYGCEQTDMTVLQWLEKEVAE